MSPYFAYAERLLASSRLNYVYSHGDVYGPIETVLT